MTTKAKRRPTAEAFGELMGTGSPIIYAYTGDAGRYYESYGFVATAGIIVDFTAVSGLPVPPDARWSTSAGPATLTLPTTTGPNTPLASTRLDWQPNTSYAVGQSISYQGYLYQVVTAFTSGATFSATNLTTSFLTSAQASGAFLPLALSPARRLLPVGFAPASRYPALGTSSGAGSDTGLNTRLRQTSIAPVRGLVARYGNVTNQSSAEAAGNNSITITAAIEYNQLGSAGGALVFWPLFFNGQRAVSLAPGAIVDSDPLGIDIPAGANWWVRTYVTLTSGGSWPIGVLARVSNSDGTQSGTSTSDMTLGGTFTTLGGDTVTYGPMGLFTPRRNATSSVALVGDSITNGTGDTPTIGNGYAERALTAANVPHVAVPMPGSAVNTFTPFGAKYRLNAIKECSSALWMYGINDLQTTSTTLATLQATTIYGWNMLAGLDLASFYVCTLLPHTTSTDSWATLTNQTPLTDDGVRTGFNDWLRDGAPILNGVAAIAGSSATGTVRMGAVGHPVTGYFETADQAESSRNSGQWRINGSPNYATADGLHPTPAIHAAVATAINPAVFA